MSGDAKDEGEGARRPAEGCGVLTRGDVETVFRSLVSKEIEQILEREVPPMVAEMLRQRRG